MQGEPSWESYAAEGDTPEACLGHKLSIKKRDSAAAIKDLTLQHIKRLRALGWHLHLQCGRYDRSCWVYNVCGTSNASGLTRSSRL